MIENLHIVRRVGVKDKSGVIQVITDITHEVVYHSVSVSDVIQWAVDTLAGEGGEIEISRGKYSLTETVKLGDNVCLKGSGRSTKLLVTDTAGLVGSGVKGVEISNLGIVSAGSAAEAVGTTIQSFYPKLTEDFITAITGDRYQE